MSSRIATVTVFPATGWQLYAIVPSFCCGCIVLCFTWGLGTEVRIFLGQENFLGESRIISFFWTVYLDAFPHVIVHLAHHRLNLRFLFVAARLVASFLPVEWGEQCGFTYPHECTRSPGILKNPEGGLGIFTCCLQAARASVNLLKPWTKAGVSLLPILQWIHEAFIRMTRD